MYALWNTNWAAQGDKWSLRTKTSTVCKWGAISFFLPFLTFDENQSQVLKWRRRKREQKTCFSTSRHLHIAWLLPPNISLPLSPPIPVWSSRTTCQLGPIRTGSISSALTLQWKWHQSLPPLWLFEDKGRIRSAGQYQKAAFEPLSLLPRATSEPLAPHPSPSSSSPHSRWRRQIKSDCFGESADWCHRKRLGGRIDGGVVVGRCYLLAVTPFFRSRCCPPQIPTSLNLGFVLLSFFFFFFLPAVLRGFWEPCQKKKKKLKTPKHRRESLFTLSCVFKKLKRGEWTWGSHADFPFQPLFMVMGLFFYCCFFPLVTPNHPAAAWVTFYIQDIRQLVFIGADRQSLTSSLSPVLHLALITCSHPLTVLLLFPGRSRGRRIPRSTAGRRGYSLAAATKTVTSCSGGLASCLKLGEIHNWINPPLTPPRTAAFTFKLLITLITRLLLVSTFM